jgi:hypothetical protein
LIGSTEWVAAKRAELQAKALAYINTDVGVTGSHFSAAATPSLKEFVRDATRQVGGSRDQRDRVRRMARTHGYTPSMKSPARPGKLPKTGESPERRPWARWAPARISRPFSTTREYPSIDVGFRRRLRRLPLAL